MATKMRPDEGLFSVSTRYSVFYEVERDGAEIHINVLDSDTGKRAGYVTMDIVTAERVAREMLAEVARVERILEAQAGAA